MTNLPCSGRILIVADAVTEQAVCTSGSVVEYRLAKARVAGSNPVSCSLKKLGIVERSTVPVFRFTCPIVYKLYTFLIQSMPWTSVETYTNRDDTINKTTQDNEEDDHEKRL